MFQNQTTDDTVTFSCSFWALPSDSLQVIWVAEYFGTTNNGATAHRTRISSASDVISKSSVVLYDSAINMAGPNQQQKTTTTSYNTNNNRTRQLADVTNNSELDDVDDVRDDHDEHNEEASQQAEKNTSKLANLHNYQVVRLFAAGGSRLLVRESTLSSSSLAQLLVGSLLKQTQLIIDNVRRDDSAR